VSFVKRETKIMNKKNKEIKITNKKLKENQNYNLIYNFTHFAIDIKCEDAETKLLYIAYLKML